jgi:hypothetical protein
VALFGRLSTGKPAVNRANLLSGHCEDEFASVPSPGFEVRVRRDKLDVAFDIPRTE